MHDTPLLFVIDDEPGILSLVERAVSSTGYRTVLHSNSADALAILEHERADAALVDVRTPEAGGLDVLRTIRHVQPACGVILMTGDGSVESAIEAVKLGALDYLTKPLDFERLRRLLLDVRDDLARRTELFTSEGTTARRLELCGLIGRSAVMQQLFGLVRRIAPHTSAALITGETGTGKEGIARAIHELGPCRTKRFAAMNCSALVDTSFEAADGGTLFLDEIGELPAAAQAKLLRVLETDVCILAATTRDLRIEADAGRFRSDLLHRLNVVELHVPPLRDRREDIPYLTAAFVKEFAGRLGKPIDGVSATAEQILMSGAWSGNVRELRNVLERACMLAEGHVLTERDVVGVIPAQADAPARAHAAPPVDQDLDQVERDHIVRVLADLKGNKQAAARRLGISRRTLYRRLERHKL